MEIFVKCRYGWRGLFASAGSLILVSSIIIASLIGYYNLDPMALGKLINAGLLDYMYVETFSFIYIYICIVCLGSM